MFVVGGEVLHAVFVVVGEVDMQCLLLVVYSVCCCRCTVFVVVGETGVQCLL